MSSFIQEAFHKVCQEAKQPEDNYVVLLESIPYYGGPEEGGWWGRDTIVRAYQKFSTREDAETAADNVQKLADELQEQATREYGEHCLRQMEFLEDRGLESDYLPEPDGHSEFYVVVRDKVPENYFGDRFYS